MTIHSPRKDYNEAALIEQLREEYVDGPFRQYSANCLWIRTKDKGLQRLVLNDNQRRLDDVIENQRRRLGKVRVVVLKGRQEGVSTYIQGRFIRHLTTREGKHAFILTHEQDATENLFGMANRMYQNLPWFLQPVTGKANAKQLSFEVLDSGYSIGTAGNKTVGRSQTIHYFHGSEVGFWPNAEEHTKGVLQAVPDAPDTEIILESTANGVDNFFHRFWKSAEARENEFIAVFLPWFHMHEYQKPPPEDFDRTEEEEQLAAQYNLTDNQLYWRRLKVIELNAGEGIDSGEIAFKQEYPMNAAEAFQFSGGDTLIKAETCMAARNRQVEATGNVYVGIDPSYGGDRFAVVWRQGARIYDYVVYTGSDVATFQQRLNICHRVLTTRDPISKQAPRVVSIDFAVGKDIVDQLKFMGFDDRVDAVQFAKAPRLKVHSDKFGNRRNEIYGLLTDWLHNEEFPPQIPDSDEFQADLCATPYQYDIYERKILKKKDAIKKEYGFSPDLADAAALTFANITVDEREVILPKPWPVMGGEGQSKHDKRFNRRSSAYDIGKMHDPHAEERKQLQEEEASLKERLRKATKAKEDLSPTQRQNASKYKTMKEKKQDVEARQR